MVWRERIRPSDRLMPNSSCIPGSTKATTHTILSAGSMTGVPVMPEGSMFPHGSALPGTGVPTVVDQPTFPVAVSSEYTVSFSVAAITWSPSTRGSA